MSKFGGPGPPWRAYALAVAEVAACTLLNTLLFRHLTEPSLVMIYFLGLLPVALTGVPGAAVLAALLAVAAFNFFFTAPYFTLFVYDTRYYFTFLVMGSVGVLVSVLTARLSAELTVSRQRSVEAEALSVELARANQALKTLDRLKANLISNVSHELRTPLAAIGGNVELLQDQVGGPMTPDQQGLLANVQRATQRLTQMVNYLVDFAQLESGTFTFERQVSDLRGLVSEIAETLRPRAEAAGLALSVRLPDEAVPVDMDPQRIGQVLVNLLDNAIKFTGAGGRIEVALEQDADTVRVLVRDTGIGIDAENLARIFEKFYQVDASSTREFGGAGLGLALSKALVEAHGGRIGVLSAPGQGSTFWFTLRARHGSPSRREDDAASQAQVRRGISL